MQADQQVVLYYVHEDKSSVPEKLREQYFFMGSMPCFRDLKRTLCQNTQLTPLTLSPGVTWGRVWRRAYSPVGFGVFAPGALQIFLMANSGLPLGPAPHHGLGGHRVQSLFLTQIRSDGYVSVLQLPYSVLREFHCVRRRVAGKLAFPFLAESSDG